MTPDEHNPTPPAAAPTLPGKVQGQLNEIRECAEAIVRNLREDIAPELRGNPWVETAACHAAVIVQDCAAITRHHPPLARPAAVTADAEALAEQVLDIAHDNILPTEGGSISYDEAKPAIAAVLAPVLARLKEAEADMAESLRLAQNCKDDMAAAEAKLAEAVRERDQLRAEVERLTGVVEARIQEIKHGWSEHDQLRAQLAAAQAQAHASVENYASAAEELRQEVNELHNKSRAELAQRDALIQRILDYPYLPQNLATIIRKEMEK